MIRKFILISLFVLGVSLPAFSVAIPHSRYFPIKSGFTFKLVSNKKNQMLFKSSIEIPTEAKEMGHVFVNWHMFWKNGEDLLKYQFRFRVSSGGVFYLVALSDGIYYRSVPESIHFISNYPKMGSTVGLGENMSLTYVKQYSSHKIGNKTYSNVIQARLNLADKKITLYIASGKGIVAVKTQDEVYLASS